MLNDLKSVETHLKNDTAKNITIRQMRDTALVSIDIEGSPATSSTEPQDQTDFEIVIEPEKQTNVKAKRKGVIAAWVATLSIITAIVIWAVLATVIK